MFRKLIAMSYPQDNSLEIYPYTYPHTPFPAQCYKQESSVKRATALNAGIFVSEVELSPEGEPTLCGAESMGVFLNLPEVLNLTSSISSDEEFVSNVTSSFIE